jgi:DNA-binding response OmpR family regulator
MSLSILVVDDDPTIRETLVEFFEALGHRARGAATATAGRQAVAEDAPDVALVDLRLPDASGLRLFETLRADDPEVAVIFLTGHADVPTAVQAMRQGAADFLEKPVALETLEAAVARAAEHGRLRRELAVLRAGGGTTSAASSTPSVERLVALAAQNADAPVLILGETGTGKGYVARRIHDQSTRAASAFVEINCATLSPTFVESELFGHERGAFTDAKQAKRGLFEVAGRGTVFLDEVASSPPTSSPSSSRRSRRARSAGSAGRWSCAARRGSCAPPTSPSRRSWPSGASAPTSSTGCRCSRSPCPRCASGPASSPGSPTSSCRAAPPSPRPRGRRSPPIAGRATSASSRTRSGARPSSPTASPSRPSTSASA